MKKEDIYYLSTILGRGFITVKELEESEILQKIADKILTDLSKIKL